MAERDAWIADLADDLLKEMLSTAEAVAAEAAPPEVAYDGRTVSRAEYLEHARVQSLADPTYLQRDLDRMAPASIPFPDGTMGRSLTGLRNFNEKWRAARPDLYAVVDLERASGEGV